MESLAPARPALYGYAGRRQKALTRFFLVVFFGAGGFARLDADDDGAEGAGTSGRGGARFSSDASATSRPRRFSQFQFPRVDERLDLLPLIGSERFVSPVVSDEALTLRAEPLSELDVAVRLLRAL